MLVLSRERDESIMIGDNIEITIINIKGDRVKIGIQAPAKVAVHRKEVYNAIQSAIQRGVPLDEAQRTGRPDYNPDNRPIPDSGAGRGYQR